MASKQEIESGRAFVKLYLKNDMSRRLTQALKKASGQLNRFGRDAVRGGRRIAAIGLTVSAPIAFATRTFASFDDGMREVAAVTQAVGNDFEMLTDKAKKLGASTSYTAIQVALLMAELGRAGFAPKQIDDMTGSVLSLARATKTDATQAAGIMAAAIRQFSLNAGDASRIADVLTTGANKSFNTLESLGESLIYAGPVAHDFNMSLEDTVAVLGTLGNVGIQASMAGTTIRRILLATGAEAKKLKKIFGVEFVDAAGNVRPLVDTLQEVTEATRDMGSAERAAKFMEAFGLRGITGASAIGKNIIGTRDLRDAIGEAGGVAKKTADDMDAGLGGAFRILRSAIEGVQIAIGDALAPNLQKLTKWITITAQSSIEWIKANKGLVVALAATAAGTVMLGIALMGIGGAAYIGSIALGCLNIVLGGLAIIVSAMLSPLGLITVAVVGATVAFIKWTESGQAAYQSLSAGLGSLLSQIKEVFGAIAAAVSAGEWELAGKVAMAGIKLAWRKGINWLKETWRGFQVFFIDRFGETAAKFLRKFQFVLTSMAQGLSKIDPRLGAPVLKAALVVSNAETALKRADRAVEEGTFGAADAVEETNALKEARKQLDEAIKKTKALQTDGAAVAEGAAGGGGEAGIPGIGGLQAAIAPSGSALTATYSAAAAQIAGYQAGGPEKKMADGIGNIDKNTQELLMQVAMFVAGQRVV